LALCLAALLVQGEANAFGADAPRPTDPAPATSGTGTPLPPKAKPKPAPRAAAGANCNALSRTETFEPGRVYRLLARRGYVSEIRLGAGDSISTSPMGGDTDGWDVVAPIGSTVVTVKPRRVAENSNLILQTAFRSYLIGLEVAADHSPCKGEWQLTFQLPAPPIVLPAELPGAAAAREARALQEAAVASPPGRNWSYSMQALPGSDDILPTEVYDDGRFTFIRVAGNRELPSVFRISTDGTESFVERHMEGRDLMVVHDVSRQWVLRLDKQVVGLWNEAFDIEGVPPVAGARSDRIRRVVRGGNSND
jgi:type IV secretion system protein VirB9